MVATVDEVRDARRHLSQARDELRERGEDADREVPLGTMIETPASALAARQLAAEVDFFSIGTNDLTQYTMAADREHGDLSGLSDALHPAVLQLVRRTAAAARETDVPVSVCGEIAADRTAVPILLGLGISHLSLTPSQIPPIKALIRHLDVGACRHLAADALRAADARAVRDLSQNFLAGIEQQ
jgi:phosphoenolpyruvate-protein kinase (PTS system EI component)